MELPDYGTGATEVPAEDPAREENQCHSTPVDPKPVACLDISECHIHTVWNAKPLKA